MVNGNIIYILYLVNPDLHRHKCLKLVSQSWLIDCGLTQFSTLSVVISVHLLMRFLTPVLHTTYFPSNWLLFQIDSNPISERRMTLVTVTCQTSERMLADGVQTHKPWMSLTARIATDWPTRAPKSITQRLMFQTLLLSINIYGMLRWYL